MSGLLKEAVVSIVIAAAIWAVEQAVDALCRAVWRMTL